ncbi:MAG TPA: potassium transporter Kup [Xanthobacteraceae bacterium]
MTSSGPTFLHTGLTRGDGQADARPGFATLTLGSIGVAYGDIGTSPLYAFRKAISAATDSGGTVTAEAVIGTLSLILWALLLVVTAKYVLLLLRADNNGEGGVLALMALGQRSLRSGTIMVALGVIGAGFFYGDALITPAISVLSAVEGLKLATPAFEHFVLPLTVAILVALFAFQSRGTAKVAALFGPIITLWFLAIGVAGAAHVFDNLQVLRAFNPMRGLFFLAGHGQIGLLTLGAVFLAVTGAEALYADLGHFGRAPIQTAWIVLVLPALALNYLGQGALVLANPQASENPFFLLYPEWALLPMVGLATAASVIASQAVITGAYSLSRQAIQLGLLPRLEIRHTGTYMGQIYMPQINAWLFIFVLVFVLAFRSSLSLASAYGIAISGTMLVTTIMAFLVIRKRSHWPLFVVAALVAPFFIVDVVFFGANLLKVVDGGWLPLALAVLIMIVMHTWRRGTAALRNKTRRLQTPLADLVAMLERKPPKRVPGTAVFLTSDAESAPTALLHSLKHYKVLHEYNVILTVETVAAPYVPPTERVRIERIGSTFSRVRLRFGFMEIPNVPKALAIARKLGWQFDIMSTSFFLSRRALRPAAQSDLPHWQDRLFIALAGTASDATDFFQIPSGRVVEVGTQVAV